MDFRLAQRHADLPRLIVATRNAHKTAEIRAMIGDRFEVLDVD